MKLSYVVCKNCFYKLYPSDVALSNNNYPSNDEKFIEDLKRLAKEKFSCPSCGCKRWIRKVAWKL